MVVKIVDATGQAFYLRLDQIIGVAIPGFATPGAGKCTIFFGTAMAAAATVTVDRTEAERVVTLFEEFVLAAQEV